jgi:hypothetical protein
MVSFLLHNEQISSMRGKGTKERPPFFFIGLGAELNGKLGADQLVISLPLWPLLKYASDMEEAVEQLIDYIMSIQDEGPYLLGGYCHGSYVAYEIARRLAFRGHFVDLLALVESPGVAQADRLFRLRRRLLFLLMRPLELPNYLIGRLRMISCMYVHNNIRSDIYFREFDRVFGDYCWVRLRSGLPTYPGHATLLYVDRSPLRCLPTHGWKDLVKGGIEVHVAKGDHRLLRNREVFILLEECIRKSIGLRIKQLAKVNGSTI